MNRKEAAELLPIIQAFAEGKNIEFSSITDASKAWREVTNFPIGMINNFNFRIKPESEYRPFKDAEECWAEMEKHSPFGWVKDNDGSKFAIENMYPNDSSIYVSDEGACSFNEVFKKFKFADGTPFGVKDE